MSKILATVNGRQITQDSIDELLYTLPKEEVTKYATAEGQKQLLDELVAQELFYAQALNDELDKTQDFLNQLEITKEKLMKSYSISKYLMEYKVTDEEAEEFYKSNPDQFINPHKVRASHILVETQEEMDKILNELNSDEITFEEAAAKYSKCPSKEKGGDLGFFQKGQMVKEFEDVAFNMNENEIKTAKTMYGYHIIKLTGQQEGSTMEYANVLPQIKKYLLSIKQNDAFAEKINELKSKYTVEYL